MASARDTLFDAAVLGNMQRLSYAIERDACLNQYALTLQNLTYWLRRAALLYSTEPSPRGAYGGAVYANRSLTAAAIGVAAKPWLRAMERSLRIDARLMDTAKHLDAEYVLARQGAAVLTRDWTVATLLRAIGELLTRTVRDVGVGEKRQLGAPDAPDEPLSNQDMSDVTQASGVLARTAHSLTHLENDAGVRILLHADPDVLQSGSCVSVQPPDRHTTDHRKSYRTIVQNIRQAVDATHTAAAAGGSDVTLPSPLDAVVVAWRMARSKLRSQQWFTKKTLPLYALCALTHYIAKVGYWSPSESTTTDAPGRHNRPKESAQLAAIAEYMAEMTIVESWPRMAFLVDVDRGTIERVRSPEHAQARVDAQVEAEGYIVEVDRGTTTRVQGTGAVPRVSGEDIGTTTTTNEGSPQRQRKRLKPLPVQLGEVRSPRNTPARPASPPRIVKRKRVEEEV